MSSLKDTLKEILLRDKIISPKDLERALEKQKKSGGDLSKILVEMNLISEDALSILLSEGLSLPIINISQLKVDPDVIKLIPHVIAEKYKIFPVSKLSTQLTVAMADPLNVFTIDNIKALTGMEITAIIGRPKDILDAIDKYYEQKGGAETFEEIIQDIKEGDDVELVSSGEALNESEIESLTQEAPIIKLTNSIIQQAVLAKASDVFIEPLEDALRVRYRVDGLLREIDRMSKVLHFPVVSRIKVISDLNISERRLPQDGRFRTVMGDGTEVDFRVNVLPTALGEKIVLRVLDKNLDRIDIEALGFESTSLARLKEACKKPHGMILACGPTGSGKTTTLYSILKYIDSPGKNIVTVEDPVEYQMKGLNQVNVRSEVGLTFAASLRSILRQDPDIIMIGEIRDSDTLDIGVKAALTGHLVLSSLHTTTAPGSIVRMINMGVEPFLLCSSVLGIVAQRLLRKVCPSCCEKYEITDAVYQKFNMDRALPQKEDRIFYKAKGCEQCFHTGYSGRVGITEILILSPTIKELILSDGGEIEIKRMAREEGMATMREDGLRKAAEGETTLEEVVRITAPDEDLV